MDNDNKLLFNFHTRRSLLLPPEESLRVSRHQTSQPGDQRHCTSAGVSLRKRKMSLRSTSSGWVGEGSSTQTQVTGGSIRSQVTKREISWRRLSWRWGWGEPPRGVCVWYMRSLRKDTFSWHMVRSYLIHANRRAHTGSNKPRQQRTSEIIYIWLWYAVWREGAGVSINFFFSNKQYDAFSFPGDRFPGNGARIAKSELRGGRRKAERGCQWAPEWIANTPSLAVTAWDSLSLLFLFINSDCISSIMYNIVIITTAVQCRSRGLGQPSQWP